MVCTDDLVACTGHPEAGAADPAVCAVEAEAGTDQPEVGALAANVR